MLLSKKIAVITGSAKGMGKGMALKFAQEGCAVAVVDVDNTEADKTLRQITEKGGKGLAVECDVRVEKQVKNAAKKIRKRKS